MAEIRLYCSPAQPPRSFPSLEALAAELRGWLAGRSVLLVRCQLSVGGEPQHQAVAVYAGEAAQRDEWFGYVVDGRPNDALKLDLHRAYKAVRDRDTAAQVAA
jgi:Tfp pilus assembly protein FimV